MHTVMEGNAMLSWHKTTQRKEQTKLSIAQSAADNATPNRCMCEHARTLIRRRKHKTGIANHGLITGWAMKHREVLAHCQQWQESSRQRDEQETRLQTPIAQKRAQQTKYMVMEHRIEKRQHEINNWCNEVQHWHKRKEGKPNTSPFSSEQYG